MIAAPLMNRERWRKYDKVIDELSQSGILATRLVAGAMDLGDLVFMIVVDRNLDVGANKFSQMILDSNSHIIREIAVEACLILMGEKEYSTEAWEKLGGTDGKP